ncbi:MAG: tRNA (adenosine(37)-N6)-threonylcarbamoyltransferase complex ATPase subunit type 1 TsaE, partial [bacterium]
MSLPAPALLVRESASPEETEEIGRGLARRLGPGAVVLLYGGIGAGKSVLARGLIQALPGGEGRAVPSPTFVFVRHYPTTPPVHHVDLYRMPGGFDPGELGLDEL